MSRLAMLVKLQEQNTFLDCRLKQANNAGSVKDELIKFLIDAGRTAEPTDEADALGADDDQDVSFEAFSRTFVRSRQRRKTTHDVQHVFSRASCTAPETG